MEGDPSSLLKDRHKLQALCVAHKSVLKIDARSSNAVLFEALRKADLLKDLDVPKIKSKIKSKKSRTMYEDLPLTWFDKVALKEKARLVEDNNTVYIVHTNGIGISTGLLNFLASNVSLTEHRIKGLVKTLKQYFISCTVYDSSFVSDLQFQQIRLSSPIRLYRGLSFTAINPAPWKAKQGDIVELKDRGCCSSWSSSYYIAKRFAGVSGCVLTWIAVPDEVVIDTRILDPNQFFNFNPLKEDELDPKQLLNITPLKEDEVILRSGTRSVEVVYSKL